jgi:hypothetical protein
MKLDIISSKLDLMKETCAERMEHLETKLELALQSHINLYATRISTLEAYAERHGIQIDKLKEWRTLQIGALIIIALIIEKVAVKILWGS